MSRFVFLKVKRIFQNEFYCKSIAESFPTPAFVMTYDFASDADFGLHVYGGLYKVEDEATEFVQLRNSLSLFTQYPVLVASSLL